MRERTQDWDPGSYASFRGLRLRPALDLILQVPDLPPGDVVDLGCGDGAVAGPLRQAFGGRRIVGVDASPAMLARAAGYDETVLRDLAAWEPDEPPALLFSNAALHWLPDHGALLPRLAGLLAPGGALAVQMPRNFDAPSHRLLRDLALGAFPGRFDASAHAPPVAPPPAYHRLLAPLGEVDVWETEYLQVLAPAADGRANGGSGGHPVRRFTESTAMRPFAARLAEGELAEFVAAYDDALAIAYPREADGTVLFPFRRLFLVLVRLAGRA